jgi:hypothetical protein
MATPSRCIAGFDIGTDNVATPSPVPDPIRSLRENPELVQDLCRYAENLASESAVRKKWRLSEEVWEALGADDELVRAIEEEKTRRIRSGATKRELAQAHSIRGPTVLASIMDDTRANSRHRIDSVRALNAIADPGPEAAIGEEKVIIKIDLSADTKDPRDVLIVEAAVPKPNPIDSWDTPKQLEQEKTSLRRRDDDRDNNF